MEACYSDGLVCAWQIGVKTIRLWEKHVLPSDILVTFEHSQK
jgi:hypothetical protein